MRWCIIPEPCEDDDYYELKARPTAIEVDIFIRFKTPPQPPRKHLLGLHDGKCQTRRGQQIGELVLQTRLVTEGNTQGPIFICLKTPQSSRVLRIRRLW